MVNIMLSTSEEEIEADDPLAFLYEAVPPPGSGTYSLTTAGGRRLLAHELAHVVYHPSADSPPKIYRQADDSSDYEFEAGEYEQAGADEHVDRADDETSALPAEETPDVEETSDTCTALLESVEAVFTDFQGSNASDPHGLEDFLAEAETFSIQAGEVLEEAMAVSARRLELTDRVTESENQLWEVKTPEYAAGYEQELSEMKARLTVAQEERVDAAARFEELSAAYSNVITYFLDTARGRLGHIAELKDILFTLDMKSAWLYAEGHRTWSAIPPASQNELLALVDEHNSLTATLQELRPAFDEAYNAAIPPYVDALALAEAEFEQKRRRCDELTRQIRQFTASAEPSALQKQIETEIEMLGKEVDALMTTEEDLGTFLRFKTVMNHWDPEGKHTWVIWAKLEQEVDPIDWTGGGRC